MPPVVFCLYYIDRLFLADLAGIVGLVLQEEAGNRITDGQADIDGLTRILLR